AQPPTVIQQQMQPPTVIQQQQAQPPSVYQQSVVPQLPPGTQPTAPSITNPTPSLYPPNVYEKTFGTGNPPTSTAPVMPPASLKAPQPPVPPLKLEGIVMAPNSRLDGTVVHTDRSPQPSAKLMFR